MDEEKPKRTRRKKNQSEKKKRISPRRIMVRCDQTGVIFPSITDAARVLGVNQPGISNHLKGWRPRVGGYTFTKMVDNGSGRLRGVARPVIPKNTERYPLQIQCDQTGEIFASIREAARKTGLAKTTIRYSLVNPRKYRPKSKYTFSKVASQK